MWAVLDTAQRNVRAFSTDWCRMHVHRHRERAPLPLGSQLVLGYSIIHRKETEQPIWFLGGDLRSAAGVVPGSRAPSTPGGSRGLAGSS